MTAVVPPLKTTESGELAPLLEPVRQALLADATAEADRIILAATSTAEAAVATAAAEADAAVQQARRRAELSARAHADQRLAQIRSDSHQAVLQAQAQLNDRLLSDVHTATRALRSDPRYPALLDHLETLARSQLGAGAIIKRDAEPDGGVVAEAGSRRVDYRLVSLADRALDTLADEMAELWS